MSAPKCAVATKSALSTRSLRSFHFHFFPLRLEHITSSIYNTITVATKIVIRSLLLPLLDPFTRPAAGRADDPGRQECDAADVAHGGHETTVCFVPEHRRTAVCATSNNGLPVARIYQVSWGFPPKRNVPLLLHVGSRPPVASMSRI